MHQVQRKKAVIIDGQNTFIRSYVVCPHLDANGEPIGGIIGTMRSLASLSKELKPSLMVMCWDGEGGSAKRRSIYAEYKQGRKVRLNHEYTDLSTPKMDLDNMLTQLKRTKEYVRLMGIRQVEVAGCEGDDVVAYSAAALAEHDVTIVSTDKDFLQLIDERVNVWSPIKKKLYDQALVKAEFGVLSENFLLWKAIRGDDSDDIGGVDGVGEKSIPRMFPFLGEKESTLGDVIEHAKANRDGGKRFGAVADAGSLLTRNVELMSLKPPSISAAAALLTREQLSTKVPPRPFELRVQMARDGVSSTDADFVQQLTTQRAREEAF